MKIFLIWATTYSRLEPLMSKLKESGHEIPYWVGSCEDGKAPDLDGTIFHDHYAAWVGSPAKGVNRVELTPPGKSLIERMHRTESLVLTMMNKKSDALCVDERRHIYYGMLGYWYGVIHTYKPEAIVFADTPHTVYNYLIFELARLLGIKTVMFEDSWVSDRVLTYRDFWKGSERLHQRIASNTGKNFSVNDLSEDIKEYYLKQTDPDVDSTPTYTRFYQLESKGVRLLRRRAALIGESMKNGTLLPRAVSFIARKFKMDLKKEYALFTARLDLSKPYVYAPLSYQPERTSSPQADVFVDQILTIEILSHALPKGWTVYVKEHPTQWILRGGVRYSSSRYPGYYRRIAAIKNVFLVPIETNSFILMHHARAVAAGCGTAGWEGILRSRPMINFGYPWYRDCPEVFGVHDVESCRAALRRVADGYTVDQQRVINFLKSLDEATFHGYIEKFIDKTSKVGMEENKINLGEVILEELAK